MSKHYVGEKVTMDGIGKRWEGGSYNATVVDVNSKENTIKIQYTDGGFKRFPKDDFQTLLKPYSTDPHILDSSAYEWASDTFSPIHLAEEQFADIQQKINEALKKKDFVAAHNAKLDLEAKRKEINETAYLQTQLLVAMQKEDYLEADKVSKSIDGLKGKKVPGNSEVKEKKQESFSEILKKAANRALGGGIAGALAMVMQVSTLMWMRTIMNYQYRYGTTTKEAFTALYAQGGFLRLYKGYVPALFQGPLSRFGDTAANVGMLAFLDSYDSTKSLPVGVKTVFASIGAASFRIFLMPIDTLKTTMQVEGSNGITMLKQKYQARGASVFFYGAIGASGATFVGHYPWFATYNFLQEAIPTPNEKLNKLARNALIGFASSLVSDTVSNSIRVLKTYRQTSAEKISYGDAAKAVIEKDGVIGLFGRGLKTRLITNGAQGMMFSVAWRYLDDLLKKNSH